MDENAKRFARRILLVHVLLLAVVLLLVGLAYREIYRSTRDQVIEQARGKQEMLANQTARGIESFYQSIIDNLDLMRPVENDEGVERSATTQAASDVPERAIAAAGTAGVTTNGIGPIGSPIGAAARAAIVGPILWKQLQGRVTMLFSLDRSMLGKPHPTIRMVGTNDPNLSAEQIIAQSHTWLESVREPSASLYQTFGDVGGNLICIPYPRGRMVIALVPIHEIDTRFLQSLGDGNGLGAWVIDEEMTAMAASRPDLVGANMGSISDPNLKSVVIDLIQNDRSGSEIAQKPFGIGATKFAPAMVSVEPIHVGGKTWQLFITSSMSDVDGIVSRLFHHALVWGAIIIASITAILVSTAVQMIRVRLRMERVHHELLTRELNQAREIQLAWLPDNLPPMRSIDIAAINSPASHISGDFYNWFDLPDGRLVVTIGDVTGHGMSAAFLMATTQLLVRNTMDRLGDPGACLEEVNRQLCVQVFNGQFVTMLILVVDVAGGQLEAATAGHPAPLLADGESFQQLPIAPQLVLGVERDVKFTTEKFTLPPQSSLLLYTDGVVECSSVNGSRFSDEGLKRALYGKYENAQAMLDRVIHAVDAFRGDRELGDDLTLVAIQLQAVPVGKEAVEV
jgi:serine phosphatase RsbU (regulator of sigma subunit)